MAEQPRRGPEPVGEPSDADRTAVAQLMDEQRAARDQEAQALAEAAEPAGEPPSDAQRGAIETLRQRTAEARAAAVRGARRTPTAVGTAFDDQRAAVAELMAQQREARAAELEAQGIVDPSFEQGTAGFAPEAGAGPSSDVYGYFECPTCGAQVEHAYPGYPDPSAAERDLVCPQCGGLVNRAAGAAAAAPATTQPAAAPSAPSTPPPAASPSTSTTLEQSSEPPTFVPTSAQHTAPPEASPPEPPPPTEPPAPTTEPPPTTEPQPTSP